MASLWYLQKSGASWSNSTIRSTICAFPWAPGEKIRTHIDTVPTSAASVIWTSSPISIWICTKLMKWIWASVKAKSESMLEISKNTLDSKGYVRSSEGEVLKRTNNAPLQCGIFKGFPLMTRELSTCSHRRLVGLCTFHKPFLDQVMDVFLKKKRPWSSKPGQ